jgi:hypothetical protein
MHRPLNWPEAQVRSCYPAPRTTQGCCCGVLHVRCREVGTQNSKANTVIFGTAERSNPEGSKGSLGQNSASSVPRAAAGDHCSMAAWAAGVLFLEHMLARPAQLPRCLMIPGCFTQQCACSCCCAGCSTTTAVSSTSQASFKHKHLCTGCCCAGHSAAAAMSSTSHSCTVGTTGPMRLMQSCRVLQKRPFTNLASREATGARSSTHARAAYPC